MSGRTVIDHSSKAEDDDPVGKRPHRGKMMRHEDNAGTIGGNRADQPGHLSGLLDAEGGGRLVEADKLHVLRERAGNRDGLALTAR